jgi:hypothetical protein
VTAREARMPRRMWDDARWRRLSAPGPSAQALALRLATGPEVGQVPGVVVARLGGLAEALGWSREDIAEAWAELEREGLAEADWAAGLVWVPWACHDPGAPPVARAWREALEDAPECPLRDRIVAAIGVRVTARGGLWADAWLAPPVAPGVAPPVAPGVAPPVAPGVPAASRARPRETRIQTDPVCGSDLRPRSRISDPAIVGLPKDLTEIARAAPAADPHGATDGPSSRQDAPGQADPGPDGGREPPDHESPPAGRLAPPRAGRLRDPLRESLTAASDELPADWQPDPAADALARSLGLDPAAELAEYRAWCAVHQRRSGSWAADYALWLRRSAKFARERARRRAGPRPPALDAHPPGAGWIDTLSRAGGRT